MTSQGVGRPRVLLVVTAAITARLFMCGYAAHLAKSGFEVTLVADDTSELKAVLTEHGVNTRSLPMQRNPHPLLDTVSLIGLLGLVRNIRPDAIVYATPKASLLAAIVARILRIPVRVYELWGIRFETAVGMPRWILRNIERLIAFSSTAIVANSRSLADRAAELGIARRQRIEVLGAGSSHGVDLVRFSPECDLPSLDDQTQRFLETHPGFTVGFIGRMHPDKGINTLVEAVAGISGGDRPVKVLLVGADEGMQISRESDILLHCTGEVDDVRPYLRVFDVLVLMSLREGFPNVVLEAAAMGVPAIVSDATGCVDSVVDGVTGTVVPVGDVLGLRSAIERMRADPQRLREQAQAARQRVIKEFDQQRVWGAAESHLRSVLIGAGNPDR